MRHSLWGVLFGLFFIGSNAKASTDVHSSQQPPAKVAVRLSPLEQAIDLALKTKIGQQFKHDIAELARQGKIRVVALEARHYGESGEGCVIRAGQYYYEGLFMVLNEKQTVAELASSLIHEADHYRQIKRINSEKPATPVTIAWLEISAFATQLDFIEALENQGLTDRKALFKAGGKIVFDIMATARAAKNQPSDQAYKAAMGKMIEFGYPRQELERILVVKNPTHCQGAVLPDKAGKMLNH
jgi:hypothetical protein